MRNKDTDERGTWGMRRAVGTIVNFGTFSAHMLCNLFMRLFAVFTVSQSLQDDYYHSSLQEGYHAI